MKKNAYFRIVNIFLTLDTLPITVLLWTPEEDHEELLAYNLIKEGYAVASVHNEDEIVERALAIAPSVIVMGDCSTDDKFIAITKEVKKKLADRPPQIMCLTTRSVSDGPHPVFTVSDGYLSLPAKKKKIVKMVSRLIANGIDNGM
ncbi:MAG: hypothetical protein AB8F95_16135 [Bacteroidia bacterium]